MTYIFEAYIFLPKPCFTLMQAYITQRLIPSKFKLAMWQILCVKHF